MLVNIPDTDFNNRRKYFKIIRDYMVSHNVDFAYMDTSIQSYGEYMLKNKEPELYFVSKSSSGEVLGFFTAHHNKDRNIISGITTINISKSYQFAKDLMRFYQYIDSLSPSCLLFDIEEGNRRAFNVMVKFSKHFGYKCQVYNRKLIRGRFTRYYRVSKKEDWE